ncbi:BlaI/MecI/CopY family transcriptional regulator [Roseimicrobium sp. ORNL1]|nr:BlaI/MecI/CopY family transcriptional regulator [Roseimicrobium sp. ORNL1]
MKLLWENAPQSSPDLCEALAKSQGWKRATTMTLLRRLIDKGAISVEGGAKRWLYAPAVDRERCIAQETRGFLDRLFQGALLPMVAHCLEHQKLSRKELSELRAMLDEATEKKEKGRQS